MRFSILIDHKQEFLSTVILRQFFTSNTTAPFHFGITPMNDTMATVIASVVLPRDQRLGTDSQIGDYVSGGILMPDPAHTAQRLLLTWCTGSACPCCLMQVPHDATTTNHAANTLLLDEGFCLPPDISLSQKNSWRWARSCCTVNAASLRLPCLAGILNFGLLHGGLE